MHQRIVIASILKPTDDTRMFGKIGKTLASIEGSEVHIMGYPGTTATDPKIQFHALKKFSRLSPRRILARIDVLKKTISLKPHILIVTTHELLGVGVFARVFLGARVVYDVQENYFRNIMGSTTLPWGFRQIMAGVIRLKEYVSSLFINHFLLAEKCYLHELGFVGKRSIVIENKARRPTTVNTNRGKNKLLFTGTLAESTGVFNAIKLARALHQVDRSITLRIAGYAPDPNVYKRLVKEIQHSPFITLVGGDELVSHDDILSEIFHADFGVISYIPNNATENKIPTKLYEYLAHCLPFLLVNHQPWVDMALPFQAAIVLPEPIQSHEIYHQMISGKFYQSAPSGVYWEDLDPALLQATISRISH